jgi:hypothetical protein
LFVLVDAAAADGGGGIVTMLFTLLNSQTGEMMMSRMDDDIQCFEKVRAI